MQLHILAAAAADAVLLGQAMAPADQAALLQIWPALLCVTATSPSCAASSAASPFAAAANIVLAQRPEAAHTPPAASLTLPPAHAQPMASAFAQHAGCGAALQFDLAAHPGADAAAAAAAAELPAFAQQVNRAIDHSSKEALEDTLSELRQRLPCADAARIVRGSIDGSLQPDVLRQSLRSKLLQRSGSVSVSEDSLAATPLRLSLPKPMSAQLSSRCSETQF